MVMFVWLFIGKYFILIGWSITLGCFDVNT